ncbi:dipeptide ABC transporter ATP-binding protein [Embleya sp. NPDC050154]|uniref:dipeptide ABC transporter ATP-binding protein n=1 Tax=unclassified Embleya TaxID=2699296 RepID=UPI0037BC4401
MPASDTRATGTASAVDTATSAPDDPTLVVEGLDVAFGSGRDRIHAVRGVSLTLAAGECLAIVGESGSGKSVTARSLVGLAGARSSVRADRLELDGEDLTGLDNRRWRAIRGRRVGFVLQDALVSLDPLRRVGAEIAETLANHRVVPARARAARAVALLDEARVPEPELRARQYPHQLSGGLRQRALIASALAAEPSVLIADEPTTALDVTVQARILDLLAAKKAAGTAILLISHDLSVVARLADRVAVMYRGRFVEEGTVEDLLRAPAHPYTRALLAAVPSAHARRTRLSLPGAAASAGSGSSTASDSPAGSDSSPDSSAGSGPAGVPGPVIEDACPYAARCPLVTDRCRTEPPPRVELAAGHTARCRHTAKPWPRPESVRIVAEPTTARERGTDDVVLDVRGVAKSYRGPDRVERPAVQDVSFTLRAGQSLGVLGESGSGKTTVAQLVLGLLAPDAGEIDLLGRRWSDRPESERRDLRRHIQHVQQDPLGSFDPRWTVERIVGEALGAFTRRATRAARDRVVELLRLVGLDETVLTRRPQQLSGGQRQRVAIARALAPEPEIVVCDEPVSALDVSIQAQILDLFADLRERLGVALLFISHDLGVIHHTSDHVIVMQAGRVVESGPVDELFERPQHPYTRELLSALPRLPADPKPAPALGG